MQDLQYAAEFDGDSATLTVSGEVDEPAAKLLREAIEEHSGDFTRDLVVELTGVGYLPSAAVGVLATTRQKFLAGGASLDIVAAEGTISQRVLAVCALPHRTS